MGTLKEAEPLEGSTCTDDDCTLVLTPALMPGEVVSFAETAFELATAALDFEVVFFMEVLGVLLVLDEAVVEAEFVVFTEIASSFVFAMLFEVTVLLENVEPIDCVKLVEDGSVEVSLGDGSELETCVVPEDDETAGVLV